MGRAAISAEMAVDNINRYDGFTARRYLYVYGDTASPNAGFLAPAVELARATVDGYCFLTEPPYNVVLL